MRDALTDAEWRIIEPILPCKPRGVPLVDDRRLLNGIFWVLRSGAPWRDLPERYGPYTTRYNRFVRWRCAGVPPRPNRRLYCAGCGCASASPRIDTAVPIAANSIAATSQNTRRGCPPSNSRPTVTGARAEPRSRPE